MFSKFDRIRLSDKKNPSIRKSKYRILNDYFNFKKCQHILKPMEKTTDTTLIIPVEKINNSI